MKNDYIKLDGLIEFTIEGNRPHVLWEKFKGLTEIDKYFLSQIHDEEQDIKDLISNGLISVWSMCKPYMINRLFLFECSLKECRCRFSLEISYNGMPVVGSILHASVLIRPVDLSESLMREEEWRHLSNYVSSLFAKVLREHASFSQVKNEFVCSKKGNAFLHSVVEHVDRLYVNSKAFNENKCVEL